jgi:phage host-nuclease inhibitor protein Gam
MARVRIEGTALNSWDEVNLNLKEIAECELEIEAIEADLNTKIQDLKLEAEFKAKPIQERISKLALQIKEYVEENRHEIKGKTKLLNFGRVGFRQSTKIIIRGAKNVIKALKANGMHDCIIVKEAVNKDKLREYPDEVIASVGAGKKVDDAFWYEVDREKLKSI